MTLTTADLARILALAEDATAGPYRTGSMTRRCIIEHNHSRGPCKYDAVSWNDDEYFSRYVSLMNGAELIGGDDNGPLLNSADAAYFAALDPATVIALVKMAQGGER